VCCLFYVGPRMKRILKEIQADVLLFGLVMQWQFHTLSPVKKRAGRIIARTAVS